MKPETIYEALAHTPDEYLDSAQLAMERGKRRMGIRRAWLLAACITLSVVMVALPIASYVNWINDPLYDLPTVEIDHEMLEGVFNPQSVHSGGENTDNYETISVSDPQYLYLNKIPKSYYLPLYTIHSNPYELNIEEVSAFATPRLQRLAKATNAHMNHSNPLHQDGYWLYWSIFSYTDDPQNFDVLLGVEQTKDSHILYFESKQKPVTLDGEKVQICPSDSDEEIAKSLESIRKKLNTIFDTSFQDTLVVRSFYTLNDETHQSISVNFYDSSISPLSKAMDRSPVHYGDFIRISFDSISYPGEADSTPMDVSTIRYQKSRTPADERYETVGKAKRISLKKAEELLRQGICFADTARCPACQPDPNPARDLTDYDYVDFVYRFSKDYEYGEVDQSLAIPFYVFYKYRETDENGLQVYDYTYVPAVEFEGIEEYFAS